MALTARVREAAGEPEGRSSCSTGAARTSTISFRCWMRSIPSGGSSARRRAGRCHCRPAARTGTCSPGIGTPDPQTFLASYAAASEWLDGFLREHRVGHDRLVLGGFSQGGVMTYSLGLGQGRPRPAALTVFSSFMPTVPGFELDLSAPLPPVAIGHGTLDPVIGVEWGRQARERLEAAGAEVLYRETPMSHQLDPGFVRDVGAWLGRVIPPSG